MYDMWVDITKLILLLIVFCTISNANFTLKGTAGHSQGHAVHMHDTYFDEHAEMFSLVILVILFVV